MYPRKIIHYFHISLLVLIFMVVVILDGIPSIRFDEAKYRISYGNHIQRAVRWRHAFAQPPLCPPELHVVAFVISSPANRERRDRIRDTWANPAYHPRRDFKPLFVLGATANASLQAAIEEEMAQCNDIIQNNFLDSYRNLTYKTIAWLSWAVTRCPDVPFAMKVDDDVVVNPFNLQRFFHELKPQAAPEVKGEHPSVGRIYGSFIAYSYPHREGRWAVTKDEYPADTFPPYTSGAAYIIDKAALRQLWDHVPLASFVWIEDLFLTGMVARVAELQHVAINDLYITELSSELYEGKCIFLIEALASMQIAWERILNNTRPLTVGNDIDAQTNEI